MISLITLISLVFLLLGLIIGSFLNVVILRYSVRSFGGRSACMHCQTVLRWYDLIPVFSYVALDGKCRYCQVGISKQYPIVELATGIIFALLFWKLQVLFLVDTFNFAFFYGYCATMFCLLLVIAVYDIRHKIIPDTLALVFALLAFIGICVFQGPVLHLHVPSGMAIAAGLIVSFPFALLWLFSQGKWMGLGDAKLAVGLGWFLGFSRMLSATVLSFWIGAVVGLFLMLFSKKHGVKSEIPFAPFLVLGTLIAFLFELHIFPVF